MRFVKRFFSTLVGKVIAFCLVLLVLRMVTSSKSLKLLPQKEFEQQKQDSKQVSDDTPIKLPPTDKASKSKQPKTESKQVEESSERPEPKLPREREKEAVKPEPVTPSIPQVIEIPLDSRLVLTDKENELLTKFDPKDFKRMGETLRLFKKVHSFVWSRPKSRVISSQKDATKILEKLDNMMFSWIKPSYQSTVELRASFKGKGRGIVLCAGNGHVITAYPTLRMIRELHGFDVPFEIFYTGDSDLNAENRKKFESLGNTVARDITKLFDDKILRLGGWAVKSFALLASSFAEAMLIE